MMQQQRPAPKPASSAMAAPKTSTPAMTPQQSSLMALQGAGGGGNDAVLAMMAERDWSLGATENTSVASASFRAGAGADGSSLLAGEVHGPKVAGKAGTASALNASLDEEIGPGRGGHVEAGASVLSYDSGDKLPFDLNAEALSANLRAEADVDSGVGLGADTSLLSINVAERAAAAKRNESLVGGGLSLGGLGASGGLHWKDSDGDGMREFGADFGADLGVGIQADLRTEDPLGVALQAGIATSNPMLLPLLMAPRLDNRNLTEDAGNAAHAAVGAIGKGVGALGDLFRRPRK